MSLLVTGSRLFIQPHPVFKLMELTQSLGIFPLSQRKTTNISVQSYTMTF